MIQMSFFLRFKPQLLRTRFELISMLEARTVLAVKQAGGQITRDQGMIQASFDENSFGFWLDMLLFIEIMRQILEEAADELHGYALLLGMNNLARPEAMCRIMAGARIGGGVFVDQAIAEAMRSYITVEAREEWPHKAAALGCGAYAILKEIKIIVPSARNSMSLGKASAFQNSWGRHSSVLYSGRALMGKRTEIYLQGASFSNGSEKNEIIPLFVRFGGAGLCAITDSFTQWMRSSPGLIPAETEKKITGIWEFLFRERLREKPSAYAVCKAREFFNLLIELYCEITEKAGKPPIIILENIHTALTAAHTAAQIVIETLRARQDVHLLGICPGEIEGGSLMQWEPLFPRMINAGNETDASSQYSGLPFDIWELGYACSLLGMYFPPEYIPRLLEEAGKSPAMISRTISLMYTLNVIDTALDPRPWNEQFMEQAEAALGEKKKKLKDLVSGRLLAWVEQKKINPCVSLLEILEKLGAKIDDNLILLSIHNELNAANGSGLKTALEKGIFMTIAGQERESVIRYIAETLLALRSGGAKEIKAAFAVKQPECQAFPLLKTQLEINFSLYRLGLRDNDSALESAKRAAMLCQKSGDSCLAGSYRLMALASLSQKRINETVNYLGFALDKAAISAEPHETGIASYYAASVQLLYGNLSLSKKYAEKAQRHFLDAGNPDWADRARFLEGRLAFETGNYRQAAEIFEDTLKNPNCENSAEKQNLFEVWAYRAWTNAKAHGKACGPDAGQFPSCQKPEGMGYDAGIFQLEGLYFDGEYAKMEELARQLSEVPAEDDFIYIEQPDWRSGFSQCELLYFSWTDLRERTLGAWRSLAQSRLSSQKAAEAQNVMQDVLRKGHFPEIDTGDLFFNYAWYKVLKHSGASQVDIRTAASAAFTRLQNRAARIDDPETRRQYLKQPHCSNALWQAAVEFKLV
jgi:tetratricopeptide (TPR) repeat protein